MHLANKYEVRKQIAAATTASITSSSQHTILEKITLEIDRLSLTRYTRPSVKVGPRLPCLRCHEAEDWVMWSTYFIQYKVL